MTGALKVIKHLTNDQSGEYDYGSLIDIAGFKEEVDFLIKHEYLVANENKTDNQTYYSISPIGLMFYNQILNIKYIKEVGRYAKRMDIFTRVLIVLTFSVPVINLIQAYHEGDTLFWGSWILILILLFIIVHFIEPLKKSKK